MNPRCALVGPRAARRVAPLAAVVSLFIAGCGGGGTPGHDAGCPGGSDGGAASDLALAPGHDGGGATPDMGTTPPAGAPFALAVIPDTQYLFDQDRGNPSVLAASLQWIVDHGIERNIVFTAHLGDLTENHQPGEFAQVDQVFRVLDQHQVPYSTVAGNHDLANGGDDSTRAANEPYLTYFSPTRVQLQPGYGGATANGFNTFHIFEAGGVQFLLLALDWRMSPASVQWASDVLAQHPTLPAILTMHELVGDGGDGVAQRSAYGEQLWQSLIKSHDQIFLTLNGHYWPAARNVFVNDAGHAVYSHIANYQDRYYGGSGMIRLYTFDLARGTLAVETFSPWLAQKTSRNALEAEEVERRGDADRFTLNIDFTERFRGFRGPAVPQPPPVAADKELIDGTVAYWRFDNGSDGQAVPTSGVVAHDLSGHGNDLTRVNLPAAVDGTLAWVADWHPSQPSRMSLRFNAGAKGSNIGAYLRTADGAPLDALAFPSGYTIEAFLKLPSDCCGDHAFMGVLAKSDDGNDVGKSASDGNEPVATLSVSGETFLQWAVYPGNQDVILTNWSHAVYDRWVHVAVVNDGHATTMYVDGCPILRNPRGDSTGISNHGGYWLIGAGQYNHATDKSFYGELGDVRIVSRPLSPKELMIAR